MYIEFQRWHNLSFFTVKNRMDLWAEQYQIAYRGKLHRDRYRITFDQDDTYSFWVMTWNPKQLPALAQYRIVTDLNHKT